MARSRHFDLISQCARPLFAYICSLFSSPTGTTHHTLSSSHDDHTKKRHRDQVPDSCSLRGLRSISFVRTVQKLTAAGKRNRKSYLQSDSIQTTFPVLAAWISVCYKEYREYQERLPYTIARARIVYTQAYQYTNAYPLSACASAPASAREYTCDALERILKHTRTCVCVCACILYELPCSHLGTRGGGVAS